MEADFINDKLNIKTLLFTKAIPNYTLPGTDGHKVFSCIDCGDRYIFRIYKFAIHSNRLIFINYCVFFQIHHGVKL